MQIELDPQDPTPKFKQLMVQVQRQIVSGALLPGEKLPSVRKLGAELGINPMTISRCYQTLEKQGWLLRRKGVGMVVRKDDLHRKMENRFDFIEDTLRHLIKDASEVGYSKSELMALVMQHWDDNCHA